MGRKLPPSGGRLCIEERTCLQEFPRACALYERYARLRCGCPFVLLMLKPKRSSSASSIGLPSPATASYAEKQRWHKATRTAQHDAPPYRANPTPRIPRPRMTAILLLALTFYALCGYVTLGRSSSAQDIISEAESTELNSAPDVSAFGSDSARWAQYSPYFPVEPYAALPEGCEVDQVCFYPGECTPWLITNTFRRHSQVHIVRSMKRLCGYDIAHGGRTDSTSRCTLPH